MSTIASSTSTVEAAILMRFLGGEDGQVPEELARYIPDRRIRKLPKELARYILDRRISEQDQARMHDLVVRNQADALSPAEKEELFAYGEAGTLLSILKSKSRQALGIKLVISAES